MPPVHAGIRWRGDRAKPAAAVHYPVKGSASPNLPARIKACHYRRRYRLPGKRVPCERADTPRRYRPVTAVGYTRSQLARMEAVIATQVLADHVESLTVVSPESLRYNASFMVRGLQQLPVRVARRAKAQ